jgi:tetratricopeptide (TPR) repeat protein
VLRSTKPAESVGFYRAALAVRPWDKFATHNLGNALEVLGAREEAIAAYRRTIELDPKGAPAYHGLGNMLLDLGKPEEAVVAYRTAIELDPKWAPAHFGLGNALIDLGRPGEALAAFRRALELDPTLAAIHHGLGNALGCLGRSEEAVAAYRKALELEPKSAVAHYSIGMQLYGQGQLDAAIDEVRQATILDGEQVGLAAFDLGKLLRIAGRYGEAVDTLGRLRQRVKDDPDRVQRVDRELVLVKRDAALAPRLPAVLRGDDRPADNSERLEFARLASDRLRHAAAARLYADALACDPARAEDRQARHRYNAACAAALAGCGMGRDDPAPGEAARAAMRRHALDWLRAELAAWSKQVKSGPPPGRPAVVQTLTYWQADMDLAGVRAPDALARLPAAERAAWQAFWADVDAMRRHAATGGAPSPGSPAGELPADPFAR